MLQAPSKGLRIAFLLLPKWSVMRINHLAGLSGRVDWSLCIIIMTITATDLISLHRPAFLPFLFHRNAG